jgi:hypothetical protein
MINAQQKLRSAQRELALRRNVYPSQVDRGRLKQSVADHEIAVMEAIVADYQTIVDRETKNT